MNFYATGRTNYFSVKDAVAFNNEAADAGMEIQQKTLTNGDKQYALFCNEDGFPTTTFNEEDQDEEFSVLDFIASHIVEGEVAIVQEVGSEGQRYVNGWSAAVNSEGDWVSINIDDIYDRCKHLGKVTSRVEY